MIPGQRFIKADLMILNTAELNVIDDVTSTLQANKASSKSAKEQQAKIHRADQNRPKKM